MCFLIHIFPQLKVAVPGLLTTVTFGLLVTYLLLDQTLGSLPAEKGEYHKKIVVAQPNIFLALWFTSFTRH